VLPTTAEEIYDLLAADPVVSAALGIYTLADGTTAPAMSVLAQNESLPEGISPGGIEITITRVPTGAAQVMITEETLLNPTWRIYVLAWGSGSLGPLIQVCNRIVAILPGAQQTPNTGGGGMGVVDQVAIVFTNPTVVVSADG
jgi:hypothetical protein